jgi:hypothetical protein
VRALIREGFASGGMRLVMPSAREGYRATDSNGGETSGDAAGWTDYRAEAPHSA